MNNNNNSNENKNNENENYNRIWKTKKIFRRKCDAILDVAMPTLVESISLQFYNLYSQTDSFVGMFLHFVFLQDNLYSFLFSFFFYSFFN